MMDLADRDRVFVADLAAYRSGSGEADMMRLGGRATADDAGLRGDTSAVLLVTEANGFRRSGPDHFLTVLAARRRTWATSLMS